jgi:hypothetical protein
MYLYVDTEHGSLAFCSCLVYITDALQILDTVFLQDVVRESNIE